VADTLTRDERLRVVNGVAQDAVSMFAKGPLVVITSRSGNGAPDSLGSGTLVRSRTGCAVLTCAHVIEGGGGLPLKVGHPAGSVLGHALGPARCHPGRVDIAIAPILEPAPLLSFALSLDQIAVPGEFPLSENHPLLVVGYPEQLSRQIRLVRDERTDAGVMRRGFAHVAHLTSLAGQDRKALSIHWDKVEISAETAASHPLGITAGISDLRKPDGLSGGAVWWFGSFESDHLLWSPLRAGRLVAVPHKFTGRRQQAVPAFIWRSWLEEQLL